MTKRHVFNASTKGVFAFFNLPISSHLNMAELRWLIKRRGNHFTAVRYEHFGTVLQDVHAISNTIKWHSGLLRVMAFCDNLCKHESFNPFGEKSINARWRFTHRNRNKVNDTRMWTSFIEPAVASFQSINVHQGIKELSFQEKGFFG